MNWIQGDKYYLESDCGRYLIAKVITGSTMHYEASKRVSSTIDGRLVKTSGLLAARREIPVDDNGARLMALRDLKSECEADARS